MIDTPSTGNASSQEHVTKDGMTRRALLPALAAAGVLSSAGTATIAHAKVSAQGAETGTVWWNELRTRDPAQARVFYAGVVGWTPKIVSEDDAARPPGPDDKGYTVFTAGQQEVAGAEKIDAADATNARSGWLPYIHVDDVDAAARSAVQLGGKVVQEPFDAAGVGRMAEIEDPEGSRFVLVTPQS